MTKFFTFLFTLILVSSCTSPEDSNQSDPDKSANRGSNGEIRPAVPDSGDYRLFPYWKEGDIRYVHQVGERMAVTSRENSKEQIVDFKYCFRVLKVDEFITVELYQKNLNIPIPKESYKEGSLERVLQIIGVKGREFTNEFPFEIKIHKRTGDVVKILNEDEFVKEYTDFCDSIVSANYKITSDDEKKLIEALHIINKEKASSRLNSLTMATNYVLQMYGLECEVGGKKSTETYLTDEITSGQFSGREMPTTLTVLTEKKGKDLILSIDYSMDPADLLEALNGEYLNIAAAGEDNIEFSRKHKVVFNTISSWPKKMEVFCVSNLTHPSNLEKAVVTETITTTFHTKNF